VEIALYVFMIAVLTIMTRCVNL